MRKAPENIFFTVAAAATLVYFVFCFQIWLAGYDSIFQYFNMM